MFLRKPLMVMSMLPVMVFGADDAPYGYLYCHMDGPNNEFVTYSIATNDLVFTDVKGGAAVFDSEKLSPIEQGSRDPYVFRKHDDSGYLMTVTDMCNRRSRKWFNYGIDLLTSPDLISWKSTAFDFRKGTAIFSDPESKDVYKDWSKVERVWAPQAIWNPDHVWPDGKKGGYMVYFSMWNRAEEKYDRVYYSYADETFTTLTKPQILFDWGYAVIDADITRADDGSYRMMIKKEGGPSGIYVSHAPAIEGPWAPPQEEFCANIHGKDKRSEGASVFKRFDTGEWCLAYVDLSTSPHPYIICKTDDSFKTFRDAEEVKGVARPQHGSFLIINKKEYDRIAALTPPEGEFTAYGVGVNGKPLAGKVERVDFEDGYAVRYHFDGDKRFITDETSVWKLPLGARIWFQSQGDDYEAPYETALVGELKIGQKMIFPMTAKLPDGTYRMITEANLVNYTDCGLVYLGNGRFQTRYFADLRGFEQRGEGVTPWRVTIVAKDIKTLANCDIVRRLCPEPPVERAKKASEFAKPGRAIWQWLPAGAPRLEEQRKWIDQTVELGYEYYLIDEGWRGWKEEGKDNWACLKEVISYASGKGVKCAIWVHSKEVSNKESRQAYLRKVKDAGAVGIKIDFMPRCNNYWSNWYEETLEDTFELGLFVDFHGAVKPTGREKTWPHELAREAVRGHEWHITRYRRVLPFDHDTILPFCRLVQGHADYTPLVFNPKELIHFTWARQLAQAIVFSAPFLCTGDYPDFYLKNPALDLIKALPAVYDETVWLDGSEIGELVAVAKRKGDEWFIAVENAEQPRELSIDLSFLKDGVKYELKGYGDNDERLDAYSMMVREVSAKDKLTVRLRKGGGFAAILKPIKK